MAATPIPTVTKKWSEIVHRYECKHCWHITNKPMSICLRDGHVIQSCCKCEAIKTVHADHLHDGA